MKFKKKEANLSSLRLSFAGVTKELLLKALQILHLKLNLNSRRESSDGYKWFADEFFVHLLRPSDL
ncbi:hypothetical protein [Dysgonomonas sp. GY617]|uniref:hypothetical protein n=1 Tax=Dysgonomonas sp. GY617 TaxID=2780420 RepID=UPI001883A733|nr:hypothetical protein [Dysgonomonas sp. GY617]MBF0577380.1 hypothetical protein [Dysgonomonas sp. GY617]